MQMQKMLAFWRRLVPNHPQRYRLCPRGLGLPEAAIDVLEVTDFVEFFPDYYVTVDVYQFIYDSHIRLRV